LLLQAEVYSKENKLGVMSTQQMRGASGVLHGTRTLTNWIFILTGAENNAYDKQLRQVNILCLHWLLLNDSTIFHH